MFVAGVMLGVCLALPSNAVVVDAFRAPACQRCAGNRGIEFVVAEGSVVSAGVAGTVTFAGTVAGKNYLVLRAATNPRVRVTYGGLAAVHRQQGDVLARGENIGTATGRLHVGVRVGEQYVDPLRLTRVSPGQAAPWADPLPRYRVTLGTNSPGGCR